MMTYYCGRILVVSQSVSQSSVSSVISQHHIGAQVRSAFNWVLTLPARTSVSLIRRLDPQCSVFDVKAIQQPDRVLSIGRCAIRAPPNTAVFPIKVSSVFFEQIKGDDGSSPFKDAPHSTFTKLVRNVRNINFRRRHCHKLCYACSIFFSLSSTFFTSTTGCVGGQTGWHTFPFRHSTKVAMI